MRFTRRQAGAATAAILSVALGVSTQWHDIVNGFSAERASASSSTVAANPPLTEGDSYEPILGMPADDVVMIGASPGAPDAKEEVWAYGTLGDTPAIVNGQSYADQLTLLEHTEASGWQVVPLPVSPTGTPLSSGDGTLPGELHALGGRVTGAGGVILLTDGGIVTRDPNGAPELVPPPATTTVGTTTASHPTGAQDETQPAVPSSAAGSPSPATSAESGSEPLLGSGESLPPETPPVGTSTPYTAVEDDRHTGILIAPYGDGASTDEAVHGPGVLHYDGTRWTREAIEVPEDMRQGFTPEALACGVTHVDSGGSAPANCWLLASYRTGAALEAPNRLAIFHRTSTGDPAVYHWERQPVTGQLLGEASELLGSSSGETLNVTALDAGNRQQGAQMLTVTDTGVWVDFQAKLGSGGSADVSELIPLPGSASPSTPGALNPEGTWCYPSESVCAQLQPHALSLGAPLPVSYQSFAWPGSPGQRIITGLPDRAMLELSSLTNFAYALGAGGNETGQDGAAFSSTSQGWIGVGEGFHAADQQGQSQVVEITTHAEGDQLQEAPVPFRYPLLAVAQAPNSTPGDPRAEAFAVGLRGEIGRYTPEQGWRPESLYDSTGKAQTPTLRGVAWPESGRAYAVGDGGAMWLWRAETGLWESDPAKPLGLIANLTAIAFSPSEPDLGYAVGKGGTLLRFGKSWTQVPLPATLQQANFTSVSFAGSEALATYRTVVPGNGRGPVEVGGVAVDNGTEWQVDPTASTLLGQLPGTTDTVLSKVAGLADGGAVAAGPDLVIERDAENGPWHFTEQPLPEAENVSALAAYRDSSGSVRSIVSVDLDSFMNPNLNGDLQNGPWSGDVPPPSGPGQPPPFAPADPLPNTGYVLKETSSGWEDMEHMALEAPAAQNNGKDADMPIRPDPVLALQVNVAGTSGLAVGGQTYDLSGSNNGSSTGAHSEAEFETAAAMRFGSGADSVGADAPATVATTAGEATFAVGGEAACERSCSDFAAEGLAPDVSLVHSLQAANQIASSSAGGLRGFLYTGGRLREAAAPEAYERELQRYESLLGSGGSLPVHIAASPTDTQAGIGTGLFSSILAPFMSGVGGNAYYSFSSGGASGGPVTVIVLDFSSGILGATQESWLETELSGARGRGEPAIVMGNASLNFALPDLDGENPSPLEVSPQEASVISSVLVRGGASAYLFDYPGVNVQAQVSFGGSHIPAFGTGTLGYASPPGQLVSDSLGSSGFLLMNVATAARNPATNVAPVAARIEPNISQLALDAADGVLMHRSQAALFEALARRPPSGTAVSSVASSDGVARPIGPDPYEPIPFECQGRNCADALPTDYTFTSSNPDIGDFVAHDSTSNNPRQVELGSDGLPVPDSQSGLFCAFNPGTTTVSITAGGLTYSESVTVQAGSVEYPCGTVPLRHPPSAEAAAQTRIDAPELPPASSPPAASPHIQSVIPPPLPAPTPTKAPPAQRATPSVQTLFVPLPLAPAGARPAIVPPPAPPVARPIPPSGTSQVSQTVGAPEEKREEESATEMASSSFVAYDANHRSELSPWVIALLVIAAGAGTGLRRTGRSRRPGLALAKTRQPSRR